MAFNYCKSCGYKNMFTLSPPKFCGGCGCSFGSTQEPKGSSLKAKPARERVEVNDTYEDFDPDGLDVFSVPKIGKLSYSVEHDKPNKLNLEDLVDIKEFEEFIEEEEAKSKTKPKRTTPNGKRKKK